MHRPIALDLVRSIMSSMQTTPRGIDRIELGYFENLLNDWPAEVFGLIPTPWGMRWYPRERIAEGVAFFKQIWRETGAAESDTVLARLRREIPGTAPVLIPPAKRKTRRRDLLAAYRQTARMLIGEKWSFGRPLSTMPAGAIYLNVGHFGLGFPLFLRWLDRRPDVKSVFMIHDTIPLDRPDLCQPSTTEAHHRLMEATARHADRLIVPTPAAGDTLRKELDRRGVHDIPIHPVSLPIDDIFRKPVAPDPVLSEHPYFVICGAVESRKNHLVLLNIWPELVRRHPGREPKLVIAGSRGFMADQVFYMIEKSEVLRRHVHFASGMSSPALAALMAHARAVVMPSFTEGFGLPPIEAMTLGTPAILSDIPPHRDAAGDHGIFVDPTDGPGWLRALGDLMDDATYADARRRIAGFDAADWPRYMRAVETILGAV